jgi:hypothetical protein
MVRHGGPYKREESLKGLEPSGNSFRPLACDVLVYDCDKGELRMHAQLRGVKELYLKGFRRHFFGREDYFPHGAKYTLDPSSRDGEASLACSAVAAVDSVRLREVHLDWGGPNGEYEVRKAADLFKAVQHRGRASVPNAPRTARAVFAVKFSDARRPRPVTIRPPNVALYVRDDDSVRVEEWLAKRGFVEAASGDDAEVADPIVVVP